MPSERVIELCDAWNNGNRQTVVSELIAAANGNVPRAMAIAAHFAACVTPTGQQVFYRMLCRRMDTVG